MPIQPNRILVHYSEIALKGKNRSFFESTLCRNVEKRLGRAGLSCRVRRTHDRVLVEIPDEAAGSLPDVLAQLKEIPGIVALAPALRLPPTESGWTAGNDDLARIEHSLVELARDHYRSDGAFAIRARRADKRFPINSQNLERRLGTVVLEKTEWTRVSLDAPDVTFHVHVYPEGVYLFTERLKGVGGLPVGTQGKVLCLLSGGIDSPVAAYLLARRGCQMDFFHMTATHAQLLDPEQSLVGQLARNLSRYTLISRLYLAPSTHLDLALLGRQSDYDLILFRRFLTRTAQTLARRIGAPALVTGDNLGQVASQTLENVVTNAMALEMPLLQPLIGFDKQEIIALARAIGTYDISIQPYKDCCALLSRNPQTKSRHGYVSRLEDRVLPNYRELLEATLADAVCVEFDCGERIL